MFCQWGFDDEANHLLYMNGISAVRWVLGGDIEKLAMTTGARIVQRFEDITADKLGEAKKIEELRFGTSGEHLLHIEGASGAKAVTFLLRGSTKAMLDEAERSIHDALCVARNLIRDNKIVYGGGSAEISSAIKVREAAQGDGTVYQYAMRAFANALEGIPQTLAANSGLSPISTVENIKKAQIETKDPYLGVDCTFQGTNSMKEQRVIETMRGKIEQFRLATQITKMILKIDDIISEVHI